MSLYRHTQNDALKAIQTQAVVCVFSVGVVSLSFGSRACVAFFCGSVICLLANILMYRCVFANVGASKAKKIIAAFYRGEIGKIVLTTLGFAGALIAGVPPVWMFGGYVFTQGMFWIFPVYWAISQGNNIK
jgi:ATP synthase protein I